MGIFVAGLLLGIASTNPMTHDVRLDHRSGAVSARYDGHVAVTHRQVGSVSAPGRPSSLRCRWSANIVVDRSARHASGSSFNRSIRRDAVVEGVRPGWCGAQRAAIARDVASQSETMRRHMLAVHAEDRTVLLAEIDRLHDANGGG